MNKILRELDRIRLDLKECEKIEVGDVEKAKKLERKGEKMLGKLIMAVKRFHILISFKITVNKCTCAKIMTKLPQRRQSSIALKMLKE